MRTLMAKNLGSLSMLYGGRSDHRSLAAAALCCNATPLPQSVRFARGDPPNGRSCGTVGAWQLLRWRSSSRWNVVGSQRKIILRTARPAAAVQLLVVTTSKEFMKDSLCRCASVERSVGSSRIYSGSRWWTISGRRCSRKMTAARFHSFSRGYSDSRHSKQMRHLMCQVYSGGPGTSNVLLSFQAGFLLYRDFSSFQSVLTLLG